MNALLNKNIIITGGNGFLGRNFCESISANGGNPIILEKNTKNLSLFVKKLAHKFNNNPSFYNCDITNEKKLSLTFNKIKKKYLKIHGLVNNAAINPKVEKLNNKNLLEKYSSSELVNEFNVGIIGALNCIKIFGYHFAKNQAGSIVNISSDLGIIAPNQSLYNSSLKYKRVKPVSYSIIKSGIIGLTKYTSTYWGHKNVRCNSLAPGGVFDKQNKSFINKISKMIPMNRMAFPEEINGPLIFLLSDKSSYVNGQTLVVDGGRVIW